MIDDEDLDFLISHVHGLRPFRGRSFPLVGVTRGIDHL
ncbi:hypothetical protein OROHE_005676 [Orobanche hederae]